MTVASRGGSQHLQGVLEAVGRSALVVVRRVFTPLAEEQHRAVKEKVSLPGLEARQVLHLAVPLLVLRPHAERALH